ncbi:MAG: HlyD family secretion protein [Hyphomicrobiaceae bacterium]
MTRKKAVLVLATLAAIGGGGWYAFETIRTAGAEAAWKTSVDITRSVTAGIRSVFEGGPKTSEFQGWVEADLLFVGADEPGRLKMLAVKEGSTVAEGAPLFALENHIQEAEWRQAKAALEEAKARLAKAETAQQRPEEIAVLEAQEARAQAAIAQSKPELDRAQTLVAKGIAPESRLDQAKAAHDRDRAALLEVRRQIEVARLKARGEDIEAAREVVAQAAARLASAETRRQQRSVGAPLAARVQEIFYRPGEIVPSGRPVVALLPPGHVKVRFFVPQADLPRIGIGHVLAVHCDGCAPDLAAEVGFISRQAEFTPPVIFSREERAKLVFRVEAIPRRPELLRPGQPVSVTFARTETQHVGR